MTARKQTTKSKRTMTADQRRARRNQIIMFSVSVILVLSMVLSLTIKW